MAPYKARPLDIDAFRWTGGPDQTEDPVWIVKALRKGQAEPGAVKIGAGPTLCVTQSDGSLSLARPGDWIARAADGGIAVYRPLAFNQLFAEAANG